MCEYASLKNWTKFENRASWDAISSREVAEALGVSLQSICNWRLRYKMPEALPKCHQLRGQRIYYRISTIISWFEGISEEEAHWNWAHKWLPDHIQHIKSLGQVEFLIKNLYEDFGVQKPRIPADFA